MHKSHADFMAGISEHDPKSFYYRRPDLAEPARREAELRFRSIMLRAGATPPQPVTPESLALEQHQERWRTQMPEGLKADLDGRIAASKEVSQAEREAAIAATQRRLGEDRYAALAANPNPPLDRQSFIATEGKRQFDELVRLAKNVRPDLPEHATGDFYVLRSLAAFGKYSQAEQASRPKV
jgi:hypothetical protein